jgi:hypothetical protein
MDERTLQSLKNHKKRPLTMPSKHDLEVLGIDALDDGDLHIIVEAPSISESLLLLKEQT